MTEPRIGLIGLGTMGRALTLNIAENAEPLAVYNRTTERTHEFMAQTRASEPALAERILPAETLLEFVDSLSSPRAIIIMVDAGPAVDKVIADLRPLLNDEDLIIDAGNANFHDTNRRAAEAEQQGVPFIGMGVSGGEEGARHGPSIMGGGPKDHWDRVAGVLQAISAKYQGTPCATWMGTGGAGHFVKAVHNGIEYADMQMIAETYGIFRDGKRRDAAAIGAVFAKWNEGPLQSYLVEISCKLATAAAPETGKPMLDIILDRAAQKGTGRWTVIEAQHLGAAIPVIEAAVLARNTSAQLDRRQRGEHVFGPAPAPLPHDTLADATLEGAMIAGKIMCYAQGFDLLAAASGHFGWRLPMPDVARVWREGCIIRSTMLNDMATALADSPDENLIFAPFFRALIEKHIPDLRETVAMAQMHGLAVPALSAALSWFDMMRTGRSTANMIQGQRDFFGAHGFERTDKDGKGFHGPWAMNG